MPSRSRRDEPSEGSPPNPLAFLPDLRSALTLIAAPILLRSALLFFPLLRLLRAALLTLLPALILLVDLALLT